MRSCSVIGIVAEEPAVRPVFGMADFDIRRDVDGFVFTPPVTRPEAMKGFGRGIFGIGAHDFIPRIQIRAAALLIEIGPLGTQVSGVQVHDFAARADNRW